MRVNTRDTVGQTKKHRSFVTRRHEKYRFAQERRDRMCVAKAINYRRVLDQDN